jgi:hypothetical protein
MKKILIKTPQCEIDFDNLCNKEYQKINSIMNLIEKEFQTDMNDHLELRHEILDISNFIKRLPTMISEVVE